MNKLPAFGVLALLALWAVAAHAETRTTRVAKSNESKQCETFRIPLPAMKNTLLRAGVEVVSAACGNTGLSYPAVCGAETGEINIFEIAETDLNKALALEFRPLSEWPEAVEVPCRDQDLAPGMAVELSMHGIGPAVDARAYRKLRLIIGDAVSAGVVDKFIVTGYGIEGGISACIEAGRFTPAKRFDNFMKRLQAIRPNPKTTSYTVQPADLCP